MAEEIEATRNVGASSTQGVLVLENVETPVSRARRGSAAEICKGTKLECIDHQGWKHAAEDGGQDICPFVCLCANAIP